MSRSTVSFARLRMVYTSADGASPVRPPALRNTWRNGKKLGDEGKTTSS